MRVDGSTIRLSGQLGVPELKEVQDRVAKLEEQFNGAIAEKTALANKVEMCSVKLERADKLIGGLGGEKIRWVESCKQFEIDYTNVVGDVLAAAGSSAR